MKNNFSCEKCQDILFDYASDLLDKKSAASVLAHISTCSECKKKFDEINAMLSVMNSSEFIEIPDNFDSILHMNLVHESEKMRQNQTETWWRRIILSRNWKSIAPAALAFVLVVSVTSTGLYQHFKNESDEFDMRDGGNGTIKIEMSSPGATTIPDFELEIVPNGEKEKGARIFNDSAQNNNLKDNKNNEYIPPENNGDKPNNNEDNVQNKGDDLQGGNIETFASDTSTKTEGNVQDNGQQDNANAENIPALQSVDEFTGDTYSIPQPAFIEEDIPEASDSSETAMGENPTSGGGGASTGVSSPRVKDTICSVTVDDINSFLNGYGYSSLSDGETLTTITVSEDEFDGFKAYAKKAGAELSIEAEGNSGVVYITISE